MLAHALPRLIDRLPPVRGELRENAPLSGITWFRTGGPAEVLFRPADLADLTAFCTALDADIGVTVLGLGSNALIRDGGLPGVTIHLGKAFGDISVDGTTVTAGAGALDVAVARAGRDRSIAGLADECRRLRQGNRRNRRFRPGHRPVGQNPRPGAVRFRFLLSPLHRGRKLDIRIRRPQRKRGRPCRH